jgi:hypothetical protein
MNESDEAAEQAALAAKVLAAGIESICEAMERMTEPLPPPAEIFDFAREHAKRQRHQIFVEFTGHE